MNHIEDWQLDAIDAVMRRCDALSDFSAEQIARTLSQMGFTIARREPRASERVKQNYCTKITAHDPHVWDYPMDPMPRVKVQCPGHRYPENHVRPEYRGKFPSETEPATPKCIRGNSPHRPHTFYSHAKPYDCPGAPPKPITQKRGPSADLVIHDEVPATFFQRTAEEPQGQNVKPCMKKTAHETHTWPMSGMGGDEPTEYTCLGITDEDEPACTTITPHERHVWEEGPDRTYGCPGVPATTDPFTFTPIDSKWRRDGKTCTIKEVYFKKLYGMGRGYQGRRFYVRFEDVDGSHVRTQQGFMERWERVQES